MVSEDDRADEITGVFLHRLPEDTWWWSDEMFRLLGYDPDAVTPTAKLLRGHVHSDDQAGLDSALEHGRTTGLPFSCYIRVVGTPDEERSLVLVGDGRTGDDGDVVVLRGFAVDVTKSVRQEARRTADSDIERARVSQEDIDLARGVLMGLYGIDADVAMRVLRRRLPVRQRQTPHAGPVRARGRAHRTRPTAARPAPADLGGALPRPRLSGRPSSRRRGRLGVAISGRPTP